MEKNKINDINSMIRIAKKYYELNLSQEQISQQEDISKSSVSRLLKRAEEEGFVRHEIIYPVKSVIHQEQQIQSYFDIEHVFVVPKMVDNISIRLNDTCKIVASDLNKIISDNDIISVSWGRTIERLSELLIQPAPPKKGIKVVQLNGSIATSVLTTKTGRILEKFAENYSGIGYMLAAPVFVDDEMIAHHIMRDSRIKNVLDMAKESEIAVFSIGQMSDHSVLIERGAMSSSDIHALRSMGAVGDLCTRYIDINGKLVDNDYNLKTIGIGLDDLKKKKKRIAIAVGCEKADALIGLLNGGYATSLYTDEITAGTVIRRCEELGLQETGSYGKVKNDG